MTTETSSQTGGIRAYARHRGITHRAVQVAVDRGRLDASVTRTEDGRVVIDFALADAEWQANSSRPTKAPPRPAGADDVEHFSVLAHEGAVVVAALRPDGDDDDLDAWLVWQLEPASARRLAARLDAVATLAETHPTLSTFTEDTTP